MGWLKRVVVSLIVAVPVLTLSAVLWPNRQVTLELAPVGSIPVDSSGLERSARIVAGRLRALNQPGQVTVAGKTIVVSGVIAGRTDDLVPFLTQPGKIELIDAGIEFPHVGDRQKIRTGAVADPDQGVYRTLLTSEDFTSARPLIVPGEDDFGFEITLTPAAAERFTAYLANQYGIYLCLAQDDVLLGCPIVQLNGRRLIIRQGPTDFLVSDALLIDQINLGVLPGPLALVKR